MGGFYVNSEDPWARRCVHSKHFRLHRAALEPNLYVAFSERLEAIQAREMNGES